MAKPDIPHVKDTIVDSDDPWRLIVTTPLPQKPTSPGFDIRGKRELEEAVCKLVDAREGYIGFHIHWSDDPDAPKP